jgi:hypothetical protein
MKHLLNGVAIAALLAITAPAWAQTPPPPAPMAPPAPSAPSAPAAPAAPMAAKPAPMPMAKPVVHHRWHHHWGWHHDWRWAEGDRMTEELNRAELARIEGHLPPGPGPWGGPPPMEGPRVSGH